MLLNVGEIHCRLVRRKPVLTDGDELTILAGHDRGQDQMPATNQSGRLRPSTQLSFHKMFHNADITHCSSRGNNCRTIPRAAAGSRPSSFCFS